MSRVIARSTFGLALATLVVVVVLLAHSACSRSSTTPASEPFDPLQDPRTSFLFAHCEKDGYFDVDTSDWLGILGATLIVGQRDPLKRARVELASAGRDGLDIARRILDTYWTDPAGQSYVRNALDVVSLSKEPEAHDLMARALDHPREEIRLFAIRAMRARGTPDAPEPGLGRASDFDHVLELANRTIGESLIDIALLLHDLDADRAEDVYVDWLGHPESESIWEKFVPYLAGSTKASTLDWLRAHWRDYKPIYRVYLAAPLARAGDSEALDYLREQRTSSEPLRRAAALNALAPAELYGEIADLLRDERDCQIRRAAMAVLVRAPDSPERRAILVQGASDSCDDTRFAALNALCARGDSRGYGMAEAWLDEVSAVDVDLGIRVLYTPMRKDAALADRVLTRLLARHAREAARPPGERAVLLQAIGQVPLEKAARFLLEQAEHETRPIQKFEPHRWLCLQTANTQNAGIPVLREVLAKEKDPLRRIDLLEAISACGGDPVRDALCELVDDDSLSPYESLFVAERLITVGPAKRAAPLVKRLALRIQKADVRSALQCLLWRSYPAPKH